MSDNTARSDEAISIWKKLLVAQRYGGLVLKIDDSNVDDGNVVVIDKKLMTDSYDELANSLPENDCRYALWTLTGTWSIFLIFWSPDSATTKSRMKYSYEYQAVKNFYQHRFSILANNPSDISFDNLLSIANIKRGGI